MSFQRSPDVPHFNDYRAYREFLRRDFRFRCAYCLTHERFFQGGDGGAIDHFRPLHPPEETGKDFSHLRNTYANLYWTCGVCNNIKGNRWPTDEEYEDGLRFLDPCVEDHEDHWYMSPNGRVTPLTTIGQYTTAHLNLNRPPLVDLRRWLYELAQRATRIQETLAMKPLSDDHRLALQNHLHDIEQIIEPPVFSPLLPPDTTETESSLS
jgi:hypothetical protein